MGKNNEIITAGGMKHIVRFFEESYNQSIYINKQEQLNRSFSLKIVFYAV